MQEQIARIDKVLVEMQRKQYEHQMQSWQIAATLLAGDAACFAAGAAFIMLVGH